MKSFSSQLASISGLLLAVGVALAASTVDSVNKYAWTENVGWTNWRDANATSQGVEVRANHLRGHIWAENVGWINTGGGGPYVNTNNTNYGVNVNPANGNLSGFAWGENIGWVNFDTSSLGADRARFDFGAGRFRGWAWGENIGWINLDDATAFVASPPPCPGDANGDGITNGADLSVLLGQFGTVVTPGSGSDFNADGIVNGADLSVLLSNFGCA